MAVTPMNKLFWKMGLPMIVSMVLQALYNVVDSIFVTNMGENGALANQALTIAFPIQILIIAIGVGTGVGLNTLLSRSLGEKNNEKVNKVAGNGIFLSLCIFLVFLLFGLFESKWFISLFAGSNKEVIEAFEDELTEKGLSEYLSVSTNLDQVEESTKTISNVSNFATTFLIITLLIGGIVLFVINMINIRERKYEIGVLRTIGMKKSLLTLQFMTELLIVAIVALFIGAGIGSLISVPVSNSLLANEIAEAEEQTSTINKNFGRGDKPMFENISGVAVVEKFKSIDAAVDIKVLCQLFIIVILLTLISSLASMISIQKFSQLTILKERS